MVEAMYQLPWESTVYRNRHGRGTRTPMFGTRLPRYRTRSGMFDDMLVAQIRRLNDAWPDWWHRYSLRSRTFRHRPGTMGGHCALARSLSPRNMAFRRASCCTVCLCNRMREAVWTCNSPSATKWCCAWRNCMDAVPKRSTRLGYVINARRSCSGWPAPARGLPSDPLRR